MRRFHRSETRILKELKSYRNKQKALKKAVKVVDNEMEKIMRKDIRKNEFRLAVLEIARYAEVNGIRGIKLNTYIKEYFCHARKRMMCNGGYNGIKYKEISKYCHSDVSLMFYIKKCVEYWLYNNHDELFIDFDNSEPGKALEVDFIPNWITQENTNALYRRKGEYYNPFHIVSLKKRFRHDTSTTILEVDKMQNTWKRVIKKRDIPNKRWPKF